MFTQNTFAVCFIIKKDKQKENGRIPIYARITVNGKRVDISIKREIDEANWNAAKGTIKGMREDLRALTAYMERFKSMIVNHYQEMVLEKKMITSLALKNRVLGIEQHEHTLLSLVEYHNIKMPQVLSPGTMKNYYTTERYIKKFLKEKMRTSDIFLVQLDYKFITDFEFFLRKATLLEKQKQMENNGVMKHIERLRKIVTLGTKMEWLPKDPFVQYKLKFKPVDTEFLEDFELAKIENKENLPKRLEYVRDLFIFSCYTSLPYADAINLTKANIVIGIDKGRWIVGRRLKTDTKLNIPILPQAQAILDKYAENPRAINEGTLFPRISNQKVNKYLKELATACEVTKNVTFHCARHTFATTVALENGVPFETVSKLMGHTKLSTTQMYARVMEKKVSRDMLDLRNKLSSPKPVLLEKNHLSTERKTKIHL